uniref:Uncharacterized protein n=1 Tax=Siphoviridae sp. ct2vX3 TaxID=2825318 RepID=A0A8S5PXI4_9CAUD|nr:MAG TPA: hypothetical protein [Siphoviridae sp. ct2vX3]
MCYLLGGSWCSNLWCCYSLAYQRLDSRTKSKARRILESLVIIGARLQSRTYILTNTLVI